MFNRFLRSFHCKRTHKFTGFVLLLHASLCVNIHGRSGVKPSRFPDHSEGKIIGGEPIKIENLPSAVQFFNFGSLCSGSIINSWSILTAAHCFDNNKDIFNMVIQFGARYIYDYDGEIREVSDFVIHSNYSKAMPFACDIAIIFVNEVITFGSTVQKAVLVTNDSWKKENSKLIAAGWGWTKYGGPISDRGLMSTRLQFVPKGKCERMHQIKLTTDMFCLYGDGVRDTCKGDSGGGVIWNGMIAGIVSHGDGCSKKHKPSIYTNVLFFRNWIRSQV
ncbi:PREDICTED: trypsin-like [Papilio polytes]|uniref:trypsin-like n=1 Tax=Papilio polytes TaxID=76194 RepID=UPI0006763CFE|nr:PREDICTED: trypsin-like [Papilio polytes]